MSSIGIPTRPRRRVENDLALDHRQSFIEALARFRLKRGFVVEIAPWVVLTDLVGAAWNPSDVTAMGKFEFEFRLLLDRLL